MAYTSTDILSIRCYLKVVMPSYYEAKSSLRNCRLQSKENANERLFLTQSMLPRVDLCWGLGGSFLVPGESVVSARYNKSHYSSINDTIAIMSIQPPTLNKPIIKTKLKAGSRKGTFIPCDHVGKRNREIQWSHTHPLPMSVLGGPVKDPCSGTGGGTMWVSTSTCQKTV